MPKWLRILREMFGYRWQRRDLGENDNLPDYPGWYRVMVTGDSESIDGHQIYAFSDYETWAWFTPDEEGGRFQGIHDEDNDLIFAWCGPCEVPRFRDARL